MRVEPTAIAGAWLITPTPHVDERGSFARLWCRREFEEHGIDATFVQSSVSRTTLRGTLRGMHFQRPPSREAKLVRCEHGRIHDVIIDLRPSSATFGEHLGLELDAVTGAALYVPAGCAHGFQSLEDAVEVSYAMTDYYAPELADGLCHDDPTFAIRWPLSVSQISERDRDYPVFDLQAHGQRYSAALREGDEGA